MTHYAITAAVAQQAILASATHAAVAATASAQAASTPEDLGVSAAQIVSTSHTNVNGPGTSVAHAAVNTVAESYQADNED